MIRFTSLTRVAVLTVAMAVSSLSAGAQALQPFRLTFGAFRSDQTTEWQATPGGDVYESGFGVFAAFGSGARNALGTWGTNDLDPSLQANVPRNLGATSGAMWGTQFQEQINIFREDPYLFNLRSIDLAHMYARSYLLSGTLSPIALTITGFKLGNVSITQTFNIPVPSILGGDITPELSTYFFDNRWTDLTEIAWLQGNGSGLSHQFTNIEGEIITPEPSTYVMLGTGLLAVFAARRRRSA